MLWFKGDPASQLQARFRQRPLKPDVEYRTVLGPASQVRSTDFRDPDGRGNIPFHQDQVAAEGAQPDGGSQIRLCRSKLPGNLLSAGDTGWKIAQVQP